MLPVVSPYLDLTISSTRFHLHTSSLKGSKLGSTSVDFVNALTRRTLNKSGLTWPTADLAIVLNPTCRFSLEFFDQVCQLLRSNIFQIVSSGILSKSRLKSIKTIRGVLNSISIFYYYVIMGYFPYLFEELFNRSSEMLSGSADLLFLSVLILLWISLLVKVRQLIARSLDASWFSFSSPITAWDTFSSSLKCSLHLFSWSCAEANDSHWIMLITCMQDFERSCLLFLWRWIDILCSNFQVYRYS